MKTREKIIIAITVLLMLIGLNTKVYAEDQIEDTTETYQEWSKLPEEEKKKYIQPLPFSATIGESEIVYKKTLLLKSSPSELPSRYSMKDDENIELKVRNQRGTGECWAFTTTNLISTNLQKTNDKINEFILFSTRHMNYSTSKTFLDGINLKGYNREVDNGGNTVIGLNYITSGKGPVLESDMPFENNVNKINLSEIEGKDVTNKVNDYVLFPAIYKKTENDETIYYNGYGSSSVSYVEYSEDDINTIRNRIKQQIYNYGAVSAYTYLDSNNNSRYFNKNIYNKGDSYYCYDEDTIANHAITIVGWDDDYAIENFDTSHQPKNKGAYICLNSHGSNVYDGGYIYISYDDVLIERELVGVVETSDIDYDNLYQYDEFGSSTNYQTSRLSMYTANIFKKENNNENKKEYLNEIGVFVSQEESIDIYVNMNNSNYNELELIKSFDKLSEGYHTIKLDTPLEIIGDEFVVCVKYNKPDGKSYLNVPIEMNRYENGYSSDIWDNATGELGQSYYSLNNGGVWKDLNERYTDSNFCIKAFTTYEKEETPEEPEEPEIPEENKQPIEDGEYKIRYSKDKSKTIFITDSGNAEIQRDSQTLQNRFEVKYIGDGYYQIISKKTNKVLDVLGAGRTNGTNVQVWTSNNSDAQKWIIKENTDGTYSIVSKCNDLYLDISGGLTNDGTNAHMYQSNSSLAQKFIFEKVEHETGIHTIDDGEYKIRYSKDKSKTIFITDSGNAEIRTDTQTLQNRFEIRYIGDGYYQIISKKTYKVIDVSGAGMQNGTNVQVWNQNNSDAQKWIIKENTDGTYSIVSKCNDLYLDISGGLTNDGTNAHMYQSNSSLAQKFIFEKVEHETGIHTIDDGEYKIRYSKDTSKTLFITDSGNAEIQRDSQNSQNRFEVKYLGDGYYQIISKKTNKVLDVSGAGITNGTNVQVWPLNNSNAQKWIIKENTDGTYSIVSKCNDLYLDISGGLTNDGTNAHMYQSNSSLAQKFIFEKVS